MKPLGKADLEMVALFYLEARHSLISFSFITFPESKTVP